MICTNYKKLMLEWLVGARAFTQSNQHSCYVALSFTQPTLQSDGFYTFDEPQADAGYSRYSFTPTITIENNNVYARNNATIYFDEATADWHGDGGETQLLYYVLCTSSSELGTGFAYGEILDDNGNPTSITVEEGQLPIIRKNKLEVNLNETIQVKYQVEYSFPTGCPYSKSATTNLYAVPDLVTDYENYTYESRTYTFAGWYYDQGYTDPASAGEKLDSNIILYAKFDVVQ